MSISTILLDGMVYATLDDHVLTSPSSDSSDLSIEVSECSPGSSAYCNQKKHTVTTSF